MTAVKWPLYSYVARNYDSNGAKQFVTIRQQMHSFIDTHTHMTHAKHATHTQTSKAAMSLCECAPRVECAFDGTPTHRHRVDTQVAASSLLA